MFDDTSYDSQETISAPATTPRLVVSGPATLGGILGFAVTAGRIKFYDADRESVITNEAGLRAWVHPAANGTDKYQGPPIRFYRGIMMIAEQGDAQVCVIYRSHKHVKASSTIADGARGKTPVAAR